MRRTDSLTHKLTQLEQSLQTWRKNRHHREPVPESLWQGAAGLARTEGVSRIARSLHLNFYELKKRAQAGQPSRTTVADRPAFVELPWAAAQEMAAACTIELENRAGSKMRVQLAGRAGELIALAEVFWRQGG